MPHISNDVTHKQRQTNTPRDFVFCSWLSVRGPALLAFACVCFQWIIILPLPGGVKDLPSYQSKHGGDDNSWYLSSVRLIRKPQWGLGVDYTADSWIVHLLATNSRCLWVGGWILHFQICLKTWLSSSAHSSKWCCSRLSLVEWQGLVNIDLTQIGESLSCLWTIVFIAIKLKFIVLSLSAFWLDIFPGILT